MARARSRLRIALFLLVANALVLAGLELALRRYAEPLWDGAFLAEPTGPANLPRPEEADRRHTAYAAENPRLYCRTAPDRQEWITPEDVDSADFNVFLLGSSAMWGVGLAWEETFHEQLARRLADVPRVRVRNCAVQAMTSDRVARTAYALLSHFDADLLVVYTGNNEFIHWYYPIRRVVAGLDVTRLSRCLQAIYLYRGAVFVQRLFRSDFPFRRIDPARSNYTQFADVGQCGSRRFKDFAGFDPRGYAMIREAIVAHYEENLHLVARRAREARVPLVVTTVPFNMTLAACYFMRQPLAIQGGAARERELARQVEEAQDAIERGDAGRALAVADCLIREEPDAPLPWAYRARALERLGDVAAARAAYGEARERVFGYLGSVLSINAAAVRAAREEGAILADIRAAIEEDGLRSGDPYLRRAFLDYCHLAPAAMRLAVEETERRLRESGVLPAPADARESIAAPKTP